MHVKIRNKIAVIEFEADGQNAGHAEVMKEIIRLLDDNFKRFVFDFKWVEISFNSGVSGFLVVTIKKLIDCGATVVIKNISKTDIELLNVVGLSDIDKTCEKLIYGEIK